MNRKFLLALPRPSSRWRRPRWAQTAAQSHGKAERRDPIFLRFPEMAQRFWENTETNAASHKVGGRADARAVRLPLCRLLLAAGR